MSASVYIETTVLSYLVARPSRDVAVNAHQVVTKLWWERAHDRFDLVISGPSTRPEQAIQNWRNEGSS